MEHSLFPPASPPANKRSNSPERTHASRPRPIRPALNIRIDEPPSNRAVVDEPGSTTFPFPVQRTPTLDALVDDLAQLREERTPRGALRPPFRHGLRRTATLISLIDELSQLREEELTGDPFDDDTQDDWYKPHFDVIQEEGVAMFQRFEGRVKDLDRRLLSFHNSVRHLGSSVGLLSSAVRLRLRLAAVMNLFRDNAVQLFPSIRRESPPSALSRTKSFNAQLSASNLLPDILETESTSTDPECIPTELDNLASDMQSLLECINQISEFAEEAVNTSVMTFVMDIKYWASCLREFKGQFRTHTIAAHIHNLTELIGEHIDSVTEALSTFVDVGVPTIRLAQQQMGSAFLNLSTVSTLFSAVTATTIQFSYSSNTNTLERSVNMLWIISLVFSLASAINSQLAYHWSSTMFRSPQSHVPWWGVAVITKVPLLFLITSVLAFSAGLVAFTFSVFPSTSIPIVITVCTSFSSLTLVIVASWFAGERWAFFRTEGKLWLMDLLSDLFPNPVKLKRGTANGLNRLSVWLKRIRVIRRRSDQILPFTRSVSSPRNGMETGVMESSIPSAPEDRTLSLGSATQLRSSEKQSQTPKSSLPQIVVTTASANSLNMDQNYGRFPLHIASAIPSLRSLVVTQQIHEHRSPIRHLAFSPNGRFLASCSWDKTVLIFLVGERFVLYKKLEHLTAVSQVAWSPDGHYLLTRQSRTIKLWEPDIGTCLHTIDRGSTVQSVVWMPSGKLFLWAEGTSVHVMDLKGSHISHSNIERMVLHDVAVTNDQKRVVAVATLAQTLDGLNPSRFEHERRIIVFNLVTSNIEYQIPVLHEVRHIALSARDEFAVVTFEGSNPPQLVEIAIDQDRRRTRLSLSHPYINPSQTHFVGPSSLGSYLGTTAVDQIVVSAGKGGEVHIWDRESARMLHSTRPKDNAADITGVSWNHGSGSELMFATGGRDGSVRIWTASSRQPNTADDRAV